jgi:16S rRNA G966 N2-methylase RsmD
MSKNSKHNLKKLLKVKRKIFPDISEDRLNKLLIDEESIKYITFKSDAEDISQIIIKNLEEKADEYVISDMTAGVGGNVLNFAKYFKYVNAIEINRERYNYLNNNIYQYDLINVNTYNYDSYNLLIEQDEIRQDIVFFDPPWGGSSYKDYDSLRLTFADKSIEDICLKLLEKNNKLIVLKLPKNYDFNYLKEKLSDHTVIIYQLDRIGIVTIKGKLI